jgi:hypothetical protein
MNTIVITLERASEDLGILLRRLQRGGYSAVLVYGGEKLAEITPFPLDTAADPGIVPEGAETPGERTGPREVISELTGLPVVTARPGARKVTSEEIYAILKDFP